jgi:hypothetical protein
MENQINEQEIIEKHYNRLAEQSTQPGDFDAVKKQLNSFCEAEKLEHSGEWYYAGGMRHVRAITNIIGEFSKDETKMKKELKKLKKVTDKNPVFSGEVEDKFSSIRKQVDQQLIIRMCAAIEILKETGKDLTEDERYIDSHFSNPKGAEVFTLENGDFIFLDNPTVHAIVENENGIILHCENGPAIEFKDGSKMYAIEDVWGLDEWIIMTPAEEMDPEKVLALENVDHRRIALQKMGMAKLIEKAVLVHEEGDRALYDFEELLGGKSRYLKMVNASNDEIHVEGVDNSCDTVQESRNFRANRDLWKPLYIDGVTQEEDADANQQQQGDVCFEGQDKLPTDAPVLKTTALLSSHTGGRHTISGGKLYGDEDTQYWVTDKAEKVTHPQHNANTFEAGVYKIWAVREMDHINGILRTVID